MLRRWVGDLPALPLTHHPPTIAWRSTTRRTQPDLRIRLVDRVDAADFALTDDAGAMAGSACKTSGTVKTVRVVEAGTSAHITIALTREPSEGALALYVHSSRVRPRGRRSLARGDPPRALAPKQTALQPRSNKFEQIHYRVINPVRWQANAGRPF